MAAPGTDEPAKALLPFLQRAGELQKHDPLIAYYCRLYAMEQGLKIPGNQRTKETSDLLISLMSQLEKDKATVKLSPEDSLYVEGFAQRVFDKADRQDRAGKADISTAKSFYAAGIFFEVASQFGPLQPELEQKQKYAVWKAGDIRKALKEGRAPTPGPPGGDDNMKQMFGSTPTAATPPANQINSSLSAPSNQAIPSLDAFGLPHPPSASPSLSGNAAPTFPTSGLPVAMPVQRQGPAHGQGQYGSSHAGGAPGMPSYGYSSSTHVQPSTSTYPGITGQSLGYPSTTGQGLGYPSTAGQNSGHNPSSGGLQGYNPSALSGHSGYSKATNPSAPPAPSMASYPSPYPSSTAGYSNMNEPSRSLGSGNSAAYPGASSAPYTALTSPLYSASTAVASTPPANSGSSSLAPNHAAGLPLNASAPATVVQSTPSSTSGNSTSSFGYSQAPPGKVAEAHKAARFAVSSLAFDDVPTAIEYLKKALDILTKT